MRQDRKQTSAGATKHSEATRFIYIPASFCTQSAATGRKPRRPPHRRWPPSVSELSWTPWPVLWRKKRSTVRSLSRDAGVIRLWHDRWSCEGGMRGWQREWGEEGGGGGSTKLQVRLEGVHVQGELRGTSTAAQKKKKLNDLFCPELHLDYRFIC